MTADEVRALVRGRPEVANGHGTVNRCRNLGKPQQLPETGAKGLFLLPLLDPASPANMIFTTTSLLGRLTGKPPGRRRRGSALALRAWK